MYIPKELIKRLASAKHVVVSTGAGVSAESDIQTFRDKDGLWTKFNAAELASVEGFINNPERVWDWYCYRVKTMSEAKPNPGHYAIAEMQNMFPRFSLITQNIDRLHQRAGSKHVYELHGNIVDNHCFECKRPYNEEIDLVEKKNPRCPSCGGRIRPSVVWFGELLPEDILMAAADAAGTCDVYFSVGTSAEVYPAANLPFQAKNTGAYIVEVNPNSTSISSYMDACLRAPSGEALPALLYEYRKYLKEKGN